MKRNTISLAWATLAAVSVMSGSAWGQMFVPGYPGDPYAADSRAPFDTTYPHEYPQPQISLPILAPLVTGRSVATGPMLGNYCATPAKTCELNRASPLGYSCSCKVPGGRVRGSVTP